MNGIARWLANLVTGGDYDRVRARADMERSHHLSTLEYSEEQRELLREQTDQIDKLRVASATLDAHISMLLKMLDERDLVLDHAIRLYRDRRDRDRNCGTICQELMNEARSERAYYQAEAESMCRSLNRFMAALAAKDRQYDAVTVRAEALRREVERQRGVIAKLREERDTYLEEWGDSLEVLHDMRSDLEQAQRNDPPRDPETGRFVRRANRGQGRSAK